MVTTECRIGFIGFGNMAQAMARGLIRSGAVRPEEICACAAHWEKLCTAAGALGIKACRDAAETVRCAGILVAAVKPHMIESVFAPLREALRDRVLVSVAAGWLFDRLEALLPGTHHVSTMPNTPVSVCAGVTLIEKEHSLTDDEYACVEKLLSALGLAQPVEGRLLSSAGAITGCGPAFVSMMLEALGDAGVRHGLPRATAYTLAAQMIAGTGLLQRETGMHPAQMKDAVCSPGGTTIAGVAALERAGLRAAVLDAIDAVEARSAELSK